MNGDSPLRLLMFHLERFWFRSNESTTDDDGISINKDLIIAGSILHDIGKINCYKFVEGGIGVCSTLSEQDHIINGTKLVSQYIQCDQLDEILHIVASHHKEKNYGSQ